MPVRSANHSFVSDSWKMVAAYSKNFCLDSRMGSDNKNLVETAIGTAPQTSYL